MRNSSSQAAATDISALYQDRKTPAWKMIALIPVAYGAIWTVVESAGLVDAVSTWWIRVSLLILAAVTSAGVAELYRRYRVNARIADAFEPFQHDLPVVVDPTQLLAEPRASCQQQADLLQQIPLEAERPKRLEMLLSSAADDGLLRYRLTSVLALLRDLQLVEVSNDGIVSARADLATYFVRSLGLHLQQQVDLIGGWDEQGHDDVQAQRARSFVRLVEEHRSATQPNPLPVRQATVAIVLIKSITAGEHLYLMQFSRSWGEYFWFVGGYLEPNKDSTPVDCAYRELREELAVELPAVISLQPVAEVSDVRISKRLGLLTDYRYHVFHAVLRSDDARVQQLWQREFTLRSSGHQDRQNRWMTWDQIEAQPELQANVSPLLNALREKAAPLTASFNEPIQG